MDELKPCPFCGGEAEIVESDYGMYLTGYAIYCRKCCLKMGVTGRLGEAYEWTPVFDSGAEAIAAWNTRSARVCRNARTDGYGFRFECCECGYSTIVHNCVIRLDELPKYCPNCGAKVVHE